MGGYYTATIPAQDYGLTVDFRVGVVDTGYQVTVDDNGGLYYSYTVGDDVDPTLTITNPANNTDQEGLLSITADADDAGAGVEYVTFNPDGASAINDYTAPYSQNWNLDDAALGSHFIDVTVRDNAGNEVTKRHYITVVDTIDPAIDSPDDIEIYEGDVGEFVTWDPTDGRPDHYVILEDGITVAGNDWNSTSETISYSLDGLSVGEYNYTCIVWDAVGNSVSDSVIVTVSEVITTPTTTTEPTTTEPTTSEPTSTDTGTTDTTTTTGGPTGGGDILTPLLLVAGIGVVGVLLVVFVVLPKMKK
jgi:plastocyanin